MKGQTGSASQLLRKGYSKTKERKLLKALSELTACDKKRRKRKKLTKPIKVVLS